MTHTRRALLRTTALAVPAAILAGCGIVSTATQNGTTTVTVNVANLTTWASGIAGVAGLLIALPGVGSLLGAAVAAKIPTILADINGAVGQMATNAAGQQVLTFTTASTPAFITSLLGDVQTLTGDVTGVLSNVGGGTTSSQVAQYATGVQTLGRAILAMLAPLTAGARVAAPLPPSQAQIDAALALLRPAR